MLSPDQLQQILDAVFVNYVFQEDIEQSIECNPDDLKPDYLKQLKKLGFNRLSIGVQSFHEKDLQLMRRSHHSVQAVQSVRDASEAGFDNLSLDLIYGIPDQSMEEWETNILQALSLPVSHISAYHLTFEQGTVFDHWRKKRRLLPVHEEESVRQYILLRKCLLNSGFEHYEISNFAREGRMSQHNLVYWSGKPYLGLGPSAHSFDGNCRSWNASSLKNYLEGTVQGRNIREAEDLSLEEKYHDYLITSLRTKWGADPEYITAQFGEGIYSHFTKKAQSFLKNGILLNSENRLVIYPDHWLIADHILRELFIDV